MPFSRLSSTLPWGLFISAVIGVIMEIKQIVMIRQIISEYIRKNVPAGVDFVVERPRDEFGDFASNVAFALAKKEMKPAGQVAEDLANKINQSLPPEIEKVTVAAGYLNFFVRPSYFQNNLAKLSQATEIGLPLKEIGQGKTVVIEYSSPNIAKPMHIGHLRNTALGDALARIYSQAGYQVIRWNYYGDWGTQFGKLIAAYKMWGDPATVKHNPVEALLELYVRFHEELKENPELEKRGQEEFKLLENGDTENVNLWLWFKGESIKEFDRLYSRLGISFDVDIGESFYEKNLAGVIDELLAQKIATESEGAIIVPLDNLPPAMIRKSDGASLYHTREIANLEYRLKEYKPAIILYVVGNEQSLHFQQLFQIAAKLKLDASRLEHVKYGLVLNEQGKKFATREGNLISAQEVIDKAVALAGQTVKEKNPDLAEAEKELVAETVGIGALKYGMIKDNRQTDIVFDWKKILDFSGNSGPYLQYTFARFNNIIHKDGGDIGAADAKLLSKPEELALMRHILDFDEAVLKTLESNNIGGLALYLYELANLASRFYEKVPVLKEEQEATKKARLMLVSVCSRVLEKGLGLLGITVLPRI